MTVGPRFVRPGASSVPRQVSVRATAMAAGPDGSPAAQPTERDLWIIHQRGGPSAAELAAMTYAGEIRPLLGPVHISAGVAVTRQLRARAVQLAVPPALWSAGVLHRQTAAWFLSCAPEPARLQFMVHRGRRTTMRPSPASAPVPWEVRQLVYPEQDVDRFFGVAVTTPLRTAADLACWDQPHGFAALTVLLGAPHLTIDPAAVVRLLRAGRRMAQRERGVMRVRKACRHLGLPIPTV
ncbi:hypothetical protein FCK90_04190 [Kocuria coralli]|uniref:AbiEi antitoxin C-terminal domain-containing protein n=1 Tax=Kocuria coralli TaxID=1461025 RepID=A0A5J5KZK6_9MICC|nr:hypothetical protein [Kocuria coralli]KAA9395109.1 hypothetical protein FCK90_04190 [Kocuria coralli]